ncbi:MAG: hypothetical protein LUI12_07705 [Clostridiales bacterium]|nr:hypothetical protein [Clostridiales bacterium]
MKRLFPRLYGNPVIHRYLTDNWFKISTSLFSSFAFNLLYAVWEIICGIYYQSYWFITLGCYYMLLMLTRLILLRETHGTKRTGWKRYRVCGVLLLGMNFVLSGIVVLAVTDGQGAHYAGYLIYAMAAYTFYRTGMAIRNLVKYRSLHNPVLTASKVISFIAAMVSMLSLEIAMILQFTDDQSFLQIMTALTGAGVCLIISGTAVYLIRIK